MEVIPCHRNPLHCPLRPLASECHDTPFPAKIAGTHTGFRDIVGYEPGLEGASDWVRKRLGESMPSRGNSTKRSTEACKGRAIAGNHRSSHEGREVAVRREGVCWVVDV